MNIWRTAAPTRRSGSQLMGVAGRAPAARELTLRNDRRSRRVLCMGHLTVGGSIYFSAERSEVGKRDCWRNYAEIRVAPNGARAWMQRAPALTGGAKL